MDGKTDGNSFQECAAPDSFSLFMFGKNSVHQMFSVAKIPQFYSHHMQKKSTLNFLPLVQLKKKSLMDICENAQSSALVFVIFFKEKNSGKKKIGKLNFWELKFKS